MPAVRTYVVEQTRTVKVRAESPADAVRIGQAAFDQENHDFRDIGGYLTENPRVIDIEAREE